jgi:hypothetical protein
LFTEWHRFLTAFSSDNRPRLLEGLCTTYRAEAQQVAQLTQHAHRMYYPHFQKRLLQIAAEQRARLPWLKEQICTLGGNLPSLACTSMVGSNSWECLRLDVNEAERDCINLLEWICLAEHLEPQIAVGLRRLREEKQQHREEFRDMLMKSDPYTTPDTAIQNEQGKKQKQAWLEQCKSEWLDHERVAWEAEGKQMPWAEWSGEQECRWATELPHRDLEWARHCQLKR